MPYLPLATNSAPAQSLYAAAGAGGGSGNVVPSTWIGLAPSQNIGITSTITGAISGAFLNGLVPAQPIPPNSYALVTGLLGVQRGNSGEGELVNFNVGREGGTTFDPSFISVPLPPAGQGSSIAFNTLSALCYNSTPNYVSAASIAVKYFADETSTCTIYVRNVSVTLL